MLATAANQAARVAENTTAAPLPPATALHSHHETPSAPQRQPQRERKAIAQYAPRKMGLPKVLNARCDPVRKASH